MSFRYVVFLLPLLLLFLLFSILTADPGTERGEFEQLPEPGELSSLTILSPTQDTILYDNNTAAYLDTTVDAWTGVRFSPLYNFELQAIYFAILNQYNNTTDGCSLYVVADDGADEPDWPSGILASAWVPPPLPDMVWMQGDLSSPISFSANEDFHVIYGPAPGGAYPGSGWWNLLDSDGTTTQRSYVSHDNRQTWLTIDFADAFVRAGGRYGFDILDSLVDLFIDTLYLPIDPDTGVTYDIFDVVTSSNESDMIDSLVAYTRLLATWHGVDTFGIVNWTDLTPEQLDSMDFTGLGASSYEDYLDSHIDPGDELVFVSWASDSGPEFTSAAVLDSAGDVRWETFMGFVFIPDSTFLPETSLVSVRADTTFEFPDARMDNIFGGTVWIVSHKTQIILNVVPRVMEVGETAVFNLRVYPKASDERLTWGRNPFTSVGYCSEATNDLRECSPLKSYFLLSQPCCGRFTGHWVVKAEDGQGGGMTGGNIQVAGFGVGGSWEMADRQYADILPTGLKNAELHIIVGHNDDHGFFKDGGCHLAVTGMIKSTKVAEVEQIIFRTVITRTVGGCGVPDEYEFKSCGHLVVEVREAYHCTLGVTSTANVEHISVTPDSADSFEFRWGSSCDSGRVQTSHWHRDTTNAVGDSTWWCGVITTGGYGNRWRQYLDSPWINLNFTEPPITLKIHHYMDMQDGFDGGNVRISINGVDWHVLEPTSPPYDVPSLYAFEYHGEGSGIPGYTGYHPWEDIYFDLSAYKDSIVLLRLEMASDDSISAPEYTGWFVDAFEVYDSNDSLRFYDYADDSVKMLVPFAWVVVSEETFDVQVVDTRGWPLSWHPEVVTLELVDSASITSGIYVPPAAPIGAVDTVIMTLYSRLNEDVFRSDTVFVTVVADDSGCGDCTGDEIVDVGDVVFLVSYLYKGGPAPIPTACVGDVNNDDIVNIGDIVYLVSYLYKSGPPPDPDCCNPPWKR